MSSWSRLLFEKENPTTTTETNTAPALASTADTVNTGPAEIYMVVNPSSTDVVNIYDDDTLTLVVLPNTTLNLIFPVTINNSLKVKNGGLSTFDYTIQFVDLS